MIVISMTALGLAGLLASDTASTLGVIGNVVTFNWGSAAAVAIGHLLMTFLATPIFIGLTGILIPGLMLAFVLPMVPWVMFIAGVTGWLILVCEAVIALPLWMLAHMTMQGEGLHGHAREGYSLLFNVLFRPTLMILGLFLGYFIFAATSWLIRMSFGIAAGFVLQNGWLVTNILGVVVLLTIFVLIHTVAAVQSFRMITLVPHHLPRLIGFGSAGRVDVEEFAKGAALVGAGSAIQGPAAGVHKGIRQGTGNLLALSGTSTPSEKKDSNGGMDTTLKAATDNEGRPPEEA